MILGILSFGGHLGRPLEYFNFPKDAKVASFSFWLRDILNNKNLYQTFVRTIFLSSRLGTQTISEVHKFNVTITF